MTDHPAVAVTPVHKSVTVKTSVDHAFHVFTAGFHTWWPKSHHIGTSPLKKAILEGKVGGRAYSEQEDGTECDWGSILAWDPPTRLIIAWQINGRWQFDPDLSRASEVEVTFVPLGDGSTRVNVEHRHLERHGAEAAGIRKNIDSPGGWGGLLDLYAGAANRSHA